MIIGSVVLVALLWVGVRLLWAGRQLEDLTPFGSSRIPVAPCPAWQQALCQQLRDNVHAADPDLHETIKRTVQPYFVLDGNLCALLATKDHVNLFVYDGAIVPDPHGLVNAGQDNATARTIA